MSVTIEEIKAAQTKLAQMIASLELAGGSTVTLPETSIQLKAGEQYAGAILNADGTVSHHLILLPGEAEELGWDDAKEWAAAAGGELPSRREQSLLYTNLKGSFREAWYWSSEQHAESQSYAWSVLQLRQPGQQPQGR